jgi:hypothetical protein
MADFSHVTFPTSLFTCTGICLNLKFSIRLLLCHLSYFSNSLPHLSTPWSMHVARAMPGAKSKHHLDLFCLFTVLSLTARKFQDFLMSRLKAHLASWDKIQFLKWGDRHQMMWHSQHCKHHAIYWVYALFPALLGVFVRQEFNNDKLQAFYSKLDWCDFMLMRVTVLASASRNLDSLGGQKSSTAAGGTMHFPWDSPGSPSRLQEGLWTGLLKVCSCGWVDSPVLVLHDNGVKASPLLPSNTELRRPKSQAHHHFCKVLTSPANVFLRMQQPLSSARLGLSCIHQPKSHKSVEMLQEREKVTM